MSAVTLNTILEIGGKHNLTGGIYMKIQRELQHDEPS